jgi:transposase-like protein
MKKLIAAVTTAGLLVVGTAGVASAAETPKADAPAHAAGARGRVALAGLKVAATTIGVSPRDLGQALKDGKSVAEVAQSHNVDPKTVKDAVDTAVNQKVDAAVAAGKIDADRAATIKSKAPDKVAKLVDGKLKPGAIKRIERRGKLRKGARAGAAKIAASTIGIDVKDLAAAVKGGQSVAQVAQSHNVDPQKVIDAVVAAANKKVDDAVAAGKLKADRAATIKSKTVDRVTKLVNASRAKATPSS